MLDLGFFRDRTFNAGNVTAFLVSFSMFATFFFITLYMQTILGLSALETGVRFLPMTILIIVTAPIAGRLSDRYGSRGLLTIGMTLVSLSLFLESRITDTTGYLTLLPAFIVGGIGMGMTMSPMTAAVMGSVDRAKAGAASGVLSMTRMIGGVFGVAALTADVQPPVGAPRSRGPRRSDVFIYALSHSLQYSAVFALAGAVVAFLFIRSHHAEPERCGRRARARPGLRGRRLNDVSPGRRSRAARDSRCGTGRHFVAFATGSSPSEGSTMNHRMATRVVVAGAALAIAVGISRPAAAHAGDTHALLQRYQPVTVLDATEQFPPTGVASFATDAALETQTAPGVWSVVDATPSLRHLPAAASQACVDEGLTPCYRLNQRDCTPLTGIASTVCYHDDWLNAAAA